MSSLDLQAVHAALRKTTEHLAAELANPTPNAPDWSPFEWRMARAAASANRAPRRPTWFDPLSRYRSSSE